MTRTMGKLGRLAPSRPHGLKDLTAYLTGTLPKPPVSLAAPSVSAWPMNGNDQYGDCVMAAAAHMIQCWNAQTGRTDPVPSEAQVVAEYLTLTGGADAGLNEADVLRVWQDTGLWGHRIFGFAPIDVQSRTTIEQGIDLFGCVNTAIMIPADAQAQFEDHRPWSLDPGWQSQQIEGGHDVPAVGYSPAGLIVVTWGGLQVMNWDWWGIYGQQCWAAIPQQYAEVGHDGIGVDVASLRADLAQIADAA